MPAFCVCQMYYFPLQTYKHPELVWALCGGIECTKRHWKVRVPTHIFLASSRITTHLLSGTHVPILQTLFNRPHFPVRSCSQSPSYMKCHFQSCTAYLLLQESNAFPANKLCWYGQFHHCRWQFLIDDNITSHWTTNPGASNTDTWLLKGPCVLKDMVMRAKEQLRSQFCYPVRSLAFSEEKWDKQLT